MQTVKKGRRAEQSQSSTSSDSPSKPEFENNVKDGFLDDLSSVKWKKVGGLADEASRFDSNGKYVFLNYFTQSYN